MPRRKVLQWVRDKVEPPQELFEKLGALGYYGFLLPEAYSDTMGHAGALVRHPDGRIEGAADPRSDGLVAGV